MGILNPLADSQTTTWNVRLSLAEDKLAFFRAHRHELVRKGGTIVWKGKGNKLFALLRDSPASNTGIQDGSRMLLGLAGIGAAASVANLAVSVVGFYLMKKKLDALSREMQLTQEILIRGFEGIEDRLVQVMHNQQQMVEMLAEARESLEDIQDIIDAGNSARLSVILEYLAEVETGTRRLSDNQVDDYEMYLRELQARNQELVVRLCEPTRRDVRSPAFARGAGYLQEWGLALLVEARLLRSVNRTAEAARRLNTKLNEWYFPSASRVVGDFLGDHSGVLLAAPYMNRVGVQHYVALEAFRRNKEPSQGDAQLWLADANQHQNEVFGYTPRERRRSLDNYDPNPYYARAVQAYNLMELGYRIGTLATEYDICARRGFSENDWERRRLPSSTGKLAMIVVDQEAA